MNVDANLVQRLYNLMAFKEATRKSKLFTKRFDLEQYRPVRGCCDRLGNAFGYCGQQILGIASLRVVNDLLNGPLFHDFPVAHYDDIVCNLGYHAKIMGNEEYRGITALLWLFNKAQ